MYVSVAKLRKILFSLKATQSNPSLSQTWQNICHCIDQMMQFSFFPFSLFFFYNSVLILLCHNRRLREVLLAAHALGMTNGDFALLYMKTFSPLPSNLWHLPGDNRNEVIFIKPLITVLISLKKNPVSIETSYAIRMPFWSSEIYVSNHIFFRMQKLHTMPYSWGCLINQKVSNMSNSKKH